MMANCVNMRACLVVFQSLKSQPFHVLSPHPPIVHFVLFHESRQAFVMSILLSFSLCFMCCEAWLQKLLYKCPDWCWTNIFLYRQLQWSDREMTHHYMISSLYRTMYRIQVQPSITIHFLCGCFSCLYSEFSWNKSHGFFCMTTFNCQIIQYVFHYNWPHFCFILFYSLSLLFKVCS